MRYLIQNRKEFAITVAAFIMAVINLYKAIRSHDVTQDLIIAVLVTGTTILAWYYNMPTSEENSRHTGQMRLEKAEQNRDADYIGETFFDDDEDVEMEESEEQPEDAHDEEINDEL